MVAGEQHYKCFFITSSESIELFEVRLHDGQHKSPIAVRSRAHGSSLQNLEQGDRLI